jgi:3-oxoacyl-[acyl-carrier-protein] synthase II
MRRVVITGLGAITPIGNDVPSMWAAMLDGRSGAGPITQFDASAFETQFAAEVKDFDPGVWITYKEVRRMDRFTHFAVAASAQAIADSGLHVTPENSKRIGAVVSSGIGGIGTILEEVEVLREKGPRRVSPFLVPKMLSDSASGQVAIHFGLRGPNMSIVSACATGSNTIGEAGEMIRRGVADVMLAGGAEAGLVPVAVAAFNAMGAISRRNDAPAKASRPFDADRDGFVIGEGSGVLILESLEHAEARSARIYAELIGYGATADAYHATAPEPSGEGAAVAMQMALDQFRLDPSQIDYLNAHGTSTPLNDKTETLAIKQVFGPHAYRLPISSTKSMIGHLMGAGGAVEAIVCVKALQEGILPPTINYETPDPDCDLDYIPNTARRLSIQTAMSNSFGFGGHNACVILRKI